MSAGRAASRAGRDNGGAGARRARRGRMAAVAAHHVRQPRLEVPADRAVELALPVRPGSRAQVPLDGLPASPGLPFVLLQRGRLRRHPAAAAAERWLAAGVFSAAPPLRRVATPTHGLVVEFRCRCGSCRGEASSLFCGRLPRCRARSWWPLRVRHELGGCAASPKSARRLNRLNGFMANCDLCIDCTL